MNATSNTNYGTGFYKKDCNINCNLSCLDGDGKEYNCPVLIKSISVKSSGKTGKYIVCFEPTSAILPPVLYKYNNVYRIDGVRWFDINLKKYFESK